MKKIRLLSIGEFSKLADIHIKSLRYYDQIGILKPAHVDPDSGYRYYAFSQLPLVEAIQMCVELGIPLKEFPAFCQESKSQIRYDPLIEYGTKKMEIKFAEVQHNLKILQLMHKEMLRTEQLMQQNDFVKMQFPAQTLWLEPCDELFISEEIYKTFNKAIKEMMAAGYQLLRGGGMLHYYHAGTETKYLYLDVDKAVKGKRKNIIRIPAMEMSCCIVDSDYSYDVKKRFEKILQPGSDYCIFENELISSDFSYENPQLELRYVSANIIDLSFF